MIVSSLIRMPLLAFILGFAISASAESSFVTEELRSAIGSFSKISNLENNLEPINACQQESQPDPYDKKIWAAYFKRDHFPFSHQQFCLSVNQISLDALCTDVSKKCRIDVPVPTGGFINYFVQDCRSQYQPLQDLRQSDQKLTDKVLTYAQNYFDEFKSDPAVLNHCCGENTACRKHFQTTVLNSSELLYDPSGTQSYFNSSVSPHQVVIVRNTLLNCRNEECIDRVIMHEMGHSCQHARHATLSRFLKLVQEPQNFDLPSSGPDLCLEDGVTNEDLIYAAGGPEAFTCVHKELAKALPLAKKSGMDPCLRSWAMEAFAELIFIPFKTELAHWATDCNSGFDDRHGPIKGVLKCYLKQPAILKQWGCNFPH